MSQSEDIRELKARHNLSNLDIARITGVSERTARAWSSDKRTTNYRPCPADAMEKLRQAVGET